MFPDSFFVLHEHDCIHCVAKSCTTTASRWLFRDSHPSQRTLWSAVIKSPKFSALGTTVPMRSLQQALVILVLRQISQFRSFAKWVKMLCLPGTTFARGAEGNSLEEVGASRCSGTLSSTRFSLNSSSRSGRSRNGYPNTPSLSFWFGFSVSAGSRDEFPHLHHSHSHFLLMRDASCDKDVGDVSEDEVEELVVRLGTTKGT